MQEVDATTDNAEENTPTPLAGNEIPGFKDDDEIFKSLGHKVRRDIIKFIGKEKKASFSTIKKAVGNIDSPALAYHLKSLQPLLDQKEAAYSLSAMGIAASKLLALTSESSRITRGKRMFFHAFVLTLACWVVAEVFVPFFFDYGPSDPRYIVHQVLINIVSATNFTIINVLRKQF
jgi:DNA-binding transcriptional ArsR family regulator